jgi:hypothetical protein
MIPELSRRVRCFPGAVGGIVGGRVVDESAGFGLGAGVEQFERCRRLVGLHAAFLPARLLADGSDARFSVRWREAVEALQLRGG